MDGLAPRGVRADPAREANTEATKARYRDCRTSGVLSVREIRRRANFALDDGRGADRGLHFAKGLRDAYGEDLRLFVCA